MNRIRKLRWLKNWAYMKKHIWNVANVPTITATIVIIAVTLIAEHISGAAYVEKARSDLHNKATQVALSLHGAIIANLESGRGMAHVVSTEPDMDTERFNQLSEKIFHRFSSMTSMALAPNLVIEKVYPSEMFSDAIGLDYRKTPTQYPLIEEARRDEHVVISSPVILLDGDQGILIHYPVFVDDAEKGRTFWGVVTSVFAMQRFYKFSGIEGENDDVLYALYNLDEARNTAEQFYGPDTINEMDPVTVTIDFRVDKWELHAVPKEGWIVPPSIYWGIRFIALVAFLLVVVPMAVVAKLSRERMAHLDAHLESQRELNRVSKRLELAVDSLKLGVWEYDPVPGLYSWDQQTRDIYGVDADYDINDHSWKERIFPEDRHRIFEEGPEIIKKEGRYCTDYRLMLPDGSVKNVRVTAFSWVNEDGEMRYLGVNWDITQHVAREEALKQAREESEQRYVELNNVKTRIEYNALHDFLTGLPNRRYIYEFLEGMHEIKWPLASPANSWLLKIDLDGFKEVNDSFGHATGDAMLVKVSNLLKSLQQEGECIARVGGDEFVMLCSSEQNSRRPQELAESFITALDEPLIHNGLICRLGASIGVSNWHDAQGNLDRLRTNADLALYQSKQNGKGCFTFFSQPLFQRATEKRRLADDLLRGIENREFIAHYQGQYKADNHQLAGAEALARWLHPERGLVFPDQFIELADGLGVTAEIDLMIMEHAIETQKIWAEKGLEIDRVSVNVSAKRLSDRELLPSLKALDFNPKRVTFELIESTFLDRSAPQVASNICDLREMGIEIEIDDFGTAYASIVSLTHLLPNKLKIDRELVFPVTTSEDQRELVHSIIHIGRTLGIGVVAEGVESMEHAEFLRIMGADLLQGYAFSKPMSRERFFNHHIKQHRINVA